MFKEMGKQIDSERLGVKKKVDELKDKIQQTEKNLNALQGERSKVKQSRFDNSMIFEPKLFLSSTLKEIRILSIFVLSVILHIDPSKWLVLV